jgi:hypothetical protein
MADSLYVLCRSQAPVTADALQASIRSEGVFQNVPIHVNPSASPTDWKTLTVKWHTRAKPIIFSRYFDTDCSEAIIGILSELPSTKTQAERLARADAARATQIIRIDYDASRLTDAIWEALDCIEAFLAFQYEGYIFAPGEGLYDAGLSRIYPAEA